MISPVIIVLYELIKYKIKYQQEIIPAAKWVFILILPEQTTIYQV